MNEVEAAVQSVLAEVLGDILRFGADAEVLEPAELRDLIRETSISMSRIYKNTPVG